MRCLVVASLNGVAVRGWQAPLASDEMYGRIIWEFLPSMNETYPWGHTALQTLL